MSVLSQFGPPVPYAALAGSVTNGVYTVGNQTIGGVKTFTSTIVGDISGNAGTANFATSAGSVTNGVYTIGNQTIGGIKTFTSTIVGDISGNAGTVTGGVYTTGNQTIGGTKTFTSTIVGDISGNAGTVTNGVYTTGNQTIGGTKTFSLNPILSAGTANTVLVLDGSKQIAAASGLGYNATTRTLTLGVGDTPDFRIGRGASNVSTNTAVGANSLVANTTGFSNTAFGNNVLFSNTTGPWNTAIGDGALYGNIDAGNLTAIGFNALYSGGGNGLGTNTAVGANSLRSLTTGYDNTAVGADSLRATTTGRWNVAIGERALRNSTTGTWNIAIGSDTLLNTSTGPANIAIGASALGANTTGSSNVAVGHNALIGNTTGAGNTSVGAYTQSITRTGSRNITIGYASGELITTGSNNSILGSFDGNLHGIDIRTASNNIVLADGAGVPRAFYNATASTWDFRTGASPGTVRLTIGDSAVTVANVLSLAAGTALLPSLTAIGDTDTGVFFPAANTWAVATGGSGRVWVTSAGWVGVGTSSPAALLHVFGNLRVGANTAATQYSNLTVIGTHGIQADTPLLNLVSTNGATRFGYLFHTGAGGDLYLLNQEAGALQLGTNNQERMRITSGGDVGIGTTNPLQPLHVIGNGRFQGNIFNVNGFATVDLLESATGVGFRWALANNGTFRLQRSANGTYSDATTPILFDASGNVGIGTTAPGYPLTVAANASTQAIRITGRAADDIATFEFTNNTQSTTNAFIQASGTYLLFATGTTERMRIDTSGNVGIGTASPGARLNVFGSGTTSSTTGLIVEDSAGTDNLVIRDDGAYAFRGGTVGLAQTGYTTFTNLTTDRTCDADATTVAELADILGTLIVDLKTKGIIAS